MSIRQEKINRLIQRDLATVLDKMAPRILPGIMITVIDVDVSADLGVAKLYLGFLNSDDKQKSLETLEFHNTEIRRALASGGAKSMKKMPELRFYLDETVDRIERIEKLLKNLK